MEAGRRFTTLSCFDHLFLATLSMVIFHITSFNAEVSDVGRISREHTANRPLYAKDIDIIATYSDASGAVRISRVKVSRLSASWIFENPVDGDNGLPNNSQTLKDSFQAGVKLVANVEHPVGDNQSEEIGVFHLPKAPLTPVKLKCQMLRQKRRELRLAELIRQNKENDNVLQERASEQSKRIEPRFTGKYSIWRRDFESPNTDSTVKLMRDQIILAKAYAHVAKSKNESSLYNSLMKHCQESQRAIGDANSDAELPRRALNQAQAMGHVLSIAKDRLYDCPTVQRKFRAMIQSTEDTVTALKRKSSFLIQLAAKIVPRPLHCLPLQLAADYYLQGHHKKEDQTNEKIEDPGLYHYAIFSDNVLAISVVVNSTVVHAKEPEKHVFHIVTDKLNFVAMKMWFLVNAPPKATVQVENIDSFEWLNSSYCSVLCQLESARLKEY